MAQSHPFRATLSKVQPTSRTPVTYQTLFSCSGAQHVAGLDDCAAEVAGDRCTGCVRELPVPTHQLPPKSNCSLPSLGLPLICTLLTPSTLPEASVELWAPVLISLGSLSALRRRDLRATSRSTCTCGRSSTRPPGRTAGPWTSSKSPTTSPIFSVRCSVFQNQPPSPIQHSFADSIAFPFEF